VADHLVRLEAVTLGYPGRAPILVDLDWRIERGDRIGLLGPNGAGKSTLLKAIAGHLAPQAGRRHTAQTIAIGYFAQHQLEQLRGGESPLWHMTQVDPGAREQELRGFLGGFDFRGDAVTHPIARFSGGEKARLTLALLVRQRPNLLLLDEPTNHLDIEMREALAEALQDYDGALVVVAHDRHLLRATTDALWLVADGEVQPFTGDLDDYREWVLGRNRAPTEPSEASGPVDRKAQKRAEALARQREYAQKKPLADRREALEREMTALIAEKTELERWLASPEAYAPGDKAALKERIARQGDLAWRLARIEAEWLDVSEALEKLGAQS